MSGNKVGRPTDYGPRVLEMTRDYIENWKEIGDYIPMRVGLALYLGQSKRTVTRWMREEGKEEFCRLVEIIDGMQEQMLAKGGLEETYNASISKLLLAKHGYSEKHQLEHMGEGGGPVKSEYVIQPTKPKEEEAE